MCRTGKHWLLCKHRAFCVWDLEKPPGKDVCSWTSQRHLLLLLLLLLQPVLASLQSFVRAHEFQGCQGVVRDCFCSHVCAFWEKNLWQLPSKDWWQQSLQQIWVKWRKSHFVLSKLWISHLSNKVLVNCIRYFPVYILTVSTSVLHRWGGECAACSLPFPLPWEHWSTSFSLDIKGVKTLSKWMWHWFSEEPKRTKFLI